MCASGPAHQQVGARPAGPRAARRRLPQQAPPRRAAAPCRGRGRAPDRATAPGGAGRRHVDVCIGVWHRPGAARAVVHVDHVFAAKVDGGSGGQPRGRVRRRLVEVLLICQQRVVGAVRGPQIGQQQVAAVEPQLAVPPRQQARRGGRLQADVLLAAADGDGAGARAARGERRDQVDAGRKVGVAGDAAQAHRGAALLRARAAARKVETAGPVQHRAIRPGIPCKPSKTLEMVQTCADGAAGQARAAICKGV